MPTIEEQIQEAGLTGERITPKHIESVIDTINYLIVPHTCMTFCVIKLVNGFMVTGESSCVDPANFNEEIGQNISLENATSKIWQLEGYLLKQRIFESASSP